MAETVSFLIKISDDGTFKRVEVDADSLNDAIKHVKEETDRLNGRLVNLSQGLQAIDLFQQSFQQLAGAVQQVLKSSVGFLFLKTNKKPQTGRKNKRE